MTQINQNAKFTFFYLLSLVALFFMSFFTGGIWFQLINKYIPDTLNYAESFSGEFLNFAIASVIVATPIYFLMMKWIRQGLKTGELSLDSNLRKWLTYLIIFVTSVTSIGWLIGVISMYLNGGLTGQFVLKALTALIISLGVLSYYVYDIKKEDFVGQDKKSLIYLSSSLVLIVITLIFGFIIADGPVRSRQIKHDRQVLSDMQTYKYEIDVYFRKNEVLPENLDQLRVKTNSGSMIDYKVIEADKYQLCTNFGLSSSEIDSDQLGYFEEEIDFNQGYDCLEFEVDKQGLEPKIIN
jgi:hypothetical protein